MARNLEISINERSNNVRQILHLTQRRLKYHTEIRSTGLLR